MYEFTRLFVEYGQNTPTEPISFTSETEVANFYGVGSREAALAREYFTGPNASAATMIFARYGAHQRPHIIGANLINDSLQTLQAISGEMDFHFDGYFYQSNVNLAAATSFASAAALLTSALDHQPIQATLTGSWVEPETVNFVGTINNQVVKPTDGTRLLLGGKIVAPGENLGNNQAANQVILETHPGTWTTEFICDHLLTPTAMSETYSILHVGSVEGNLRVGQKLEGPDVPDLTAVIAEISPGEYLLNNRFSTGAEDMHTTPPPLFIQDRHVQGQTENRDYFSVQPNGNFGFDNTPSKLTYGSGPAAVDLGLTPGSGGLISPLGGQSMTTAQWYNSIVAASPFTSFQDELGRETGSELWATKHVQYTYIHDYWTTPAAGAR